VRQPLIVKKQNTLTFGNDLDVSKHQLNNHDSENFVRFGILSITKTISFCLCSYNST